jgi:hypothetical protein
VLCALAGATVWRALFGRGPLERVFTGVARKAFPTPGRTPDAAPDDAPDPGPDAAPDAPSDPTSARVQNVT